MKNWFGKFWPLRVGLWLLAAALCFWLWPMLAPEVASRELLYSYGRHELDKHIDFGNPVLSRVGDKTIEAWDWKTRKRWQVATVAKSWNDFLPVIRDGRVQAIVTVDDDGRIVMIDVAPPHARRVFSVPERLGMVQPLLVVNREMSFAAVIKYMAFSQKIYVLDLATGEIVDSKIEGWRVYLVEDGELEVVDASNVGIPTLEPGFLSSTRWKLAGDGRLVASKNAPVIDAEVFSKLDAAPSRITSPDGRFEAVLLKGTRIEIHERSSGQLLKDIYVPLNDYLRNVEFSTDSKYLLVGDVNTNFQVFDLETQSLVANDYRLERKWWISNGLAVSSAIALFMALALALRTPSFDRAVWDYLLTTVFWDSFVTAMISQHEWFPIGYTGTGTAAAIGIYWTFGEHPFWRRIAYGAAGLAVVYCSYLGIVTRSDRALYEGTGIFMLLALLPTLTAIAAWVATLPSGGRVSREAIVKVSPRFQFGIGSIVFAITVAGIVFGMLRIGLGNVSEEDDIATIIRGTVFLSILFLGVLVVVWLFLLLIFRRFTWLSAVAYLTIALAIIGLALQQLIQEKTIDLSGKFDISFVATRFLFFAGPLTLILVRFSFPLWLARRHGYHWVKVSKPLPASDVAAGAMP